MRHNMVNSQGRPAPDDSPLQMICLPVGQLGVKNPQHETCDPLWTRSITHSNISTPQTFSYLTVAPVPFFKWQSQKSRKRCSCSPVFSGERATHTISSGDEVFLLDADRMVAMTQSNKTVSNDVKSKYKQLEWGDGRGKSASEVGDQTSFLATQTFWPTWFKTRFNKQRCIETLCTMFGSHGPSASTHRE